MRLMTSLYKRLYGAWPLVFFLMVLRGCGNFEGSGVLGVQEGRVGGSCKRLLCKYRRLRTLVWEGKQVSMSDQI